MSQISELLQRGYERLIQDDAVLAAALGRDVTRQKNTLNLVASVSLADPSVLVSAGTSLSNVTVEGYPGARFHSGSIDVDSVESLAVERARLAFRAQYANVQPYSGSAANLAVLSCLLPPGGTLLSLGLDSGGHLTHGAGASITGQHYRAVHYGLDDQGLIDYESAHELAVRHRPKVIIAGSSSYPRIVDFARMRTIADSVGAYLLADISHIAGLVVSGCHPSPIDLAHVTTTSTYKQLGGPRGGLILQGRDAQAPARTSGLTLAESIQRAVFPMTQGTPNPAAMAAKARAFDLAAQPHFQQTCRRIVANAQSLAEELSRRGFQLLSGGTDTHMIMLDITGKGMSGYVAESALEQCGVLVNRNVIPGDGRAPSTASGVRLGTNIASQRGMGAAEMRTSAALVDLVLSAVTARGDRAFALDQDAKSSAMTAVAQLCADFPLPHY
ncbi:serine hydroxymethyltransferase [Nonomuraea sp. NPDC003804]|uniref:serine hydroxymethyltransferase n=1 Tax=Nonomuraea sp. NPDC003804 TaxID=3154547 RepID=UPI0033BD21C3